METVNFSIPWISSIFFIVILMIFIILLKNNKKKKAKDKSQIIDIHQKNQNKVSELISLAEEIANPIKLNEGMTSNNNAELLKLKYNESKNILDSNIHILSKDSIQITSRIHKAILNTYFLVKKINETQALGMPFENTVHLLDELNYIYSEDIKNSLPLLNNKLIEEIKNI